MEYTRKCYRDVPKEIVMQFKDNTIIRSDVVKSIHITEYASGDAWIDVTMCFSHDSIEEKFKNKSLLNVRFDSNTCDVNIETGDKTNKVEIKEFLNMYISSIEYGTEIESGELIGVSLSFRRFGF